MICIYAIINIINDNLYVGQTVDNILRWREHRKSLRGFYHHSIYLQRAWCKYGEENFIFVVLEVLKDKALLDEKETHWGNLLEPAYNVFPTGGSQRGYKHTEEARKNMSDAHKGHKQSEETKAKRAVIMTGNKHAAGVKQSIEHIEARARVIRGKPKTTEHKAKIGAAQIGKVISAETRHKQSLAAKNRSRDYSEETRQKLSEAAKNQHARNRQKALDEIKSLWS